MNSPSKTLPQLRAYCMAWSERIGGLSGDEDKIEFFREELPNLLLDRELIINILEDISGGEAFPDRRQGMLFDNELLLYMDGRRRFSLRMYIHSPGETTSVHDHSSWGVLGNACGTMEIVKYRRADDGRTDGYARLSEAERITCRPGRTDFTLPLDEGIHSVGNPSNDSMVVINVYGTPVRRLYINQFDKDNHRVTRVYPPRLRKRKLAAAALETMRKKT